LGIKTRVIGGLALVFLLGLCAGCGRKLPPLPPGPGEPVEIASIAFLEDGTVEARASVNIEGARVTLLGKPKGLCPACEDDLKKKDEKDAEKQGTVILKDPSPESDYMVYRIAFAKGTTSFLTGPQVVRK
jgi:hypothetical protein